MARVFVTSVRRVTVVQSSGDTDVDFRDSVDVADALSGTLGPVNAQDSFDVADMLVVSSFNGADSTAVADQFAVADTDVRDSVDVADALSGTLGPVNAQDSFDVADTLRAGPAILQDSVDVADAPSGWSLTPAALDSVDISDRISNLTALEDDSLSLADALGASRATYADSLDLADAFGTARAFLGDSADISDAPSAWMLTATAPDSLDLADALGAVRLVPNDSVDVSDNRSPVTFSGTLWPNTTVSNTGWTNPANIIDTSTATAATCAATSSGALGTGGTQNTTTCDLIISCGNPVLSDWTITNVTIEWQISAARSGIPLSAGQANINYQYSLNDGGSWTTFFAQTALNGSTSTLSLGALTQAQIDGLRFRAVGSVLSGTGLLPVTTTASWNYIRAVITASKSY